MAESMTGVVEEILDGRKIRVGGTLYSAYDGDQAGVNLINVGDSVSFRYDDKEGEGRFAGRTFHNIKGRVTKMTTALPATGSAPAATPRKASGFPVGITDHARSIIRQNSVTNATNIMLGMLGEQKPKAGTKWEDTCAQAEAVAQAITDVARILEAYSAGDADMAEAEKELDEVA